MEPKSTIAEASTVWDQRGYQPKPIIVSARPQKAQGGYQPTTGQAPPPNPPNQGTSGKK